MYSKPKNNDEHDEESHQLLPLREIPGHYGPRLIGPILSRYQYYYTQGELSYFTSRMQEHGSTVFRCNMPPGPFMSKDPRVICLLDAASFRALFDNGKVEKRDVLDGTFMPSTKFFGGHRPCAFLDPSEEKHRALKGLFMSLLARRKDRFVPLFREGLKALFASLENEVDEKGTSTFNDLCDAVSFEFVFRLLCDKSSSEIEEMKGRSGPKMFDKWIACQLAPLVSLGLKFVPNILEDLLLHTFPLPFFLVKSDYYRLYDAFRKHGAEILDEAEGLGLSRDEACHNLVFLAGFNAYGGMKAVFPTLIKWVAASGEDLHRRLADEIRAVAASGTAIDPMVALDKMGLLKSVVYEVMRMEPPVPYQYGLAKRDFVVQSHDSSYEVKKGEMLFGYQPLATRDPKVFRDPDEFVPDRFVGREGEKLVEYVYWSNGREVDHATAENKQCPGKDLVVMMCRLMIVELFMRYDTFRVEVGKLPFGSLVKFKSLVKATI